MIRGLLIGRQALQAEQLLHAYLAWGIALILGIQASVNLGVNLGLLPTKGLTLPLISYGRSSLIVTMVSIGILLRIHHELEVDSRAPNRRRKPRKKAGGRR